jgi:carboxypeptidase Q
MRPLRISAPAMILAAGLAFSLFAAGKGKKETSSKEAPRPSYELPQPEKESLDFAMYQNIREEALAHSHVMEYASGLMDGIGPRLTGSPNLKRANEWTRDQFTAMGCSNTHLEDWGEFGMGWQQLNTWVRMTSPDAAVFIAQAAPWSPATKGQVTASAVWVNIKDEADFDKYKGKIGGKIVFLGEMREVKPIDKTLFTRDEDADLKHIQEYPTNLANAFSFAAFLKTLAFREKIGHFLAAEQAVAVITPSRDGRNGGGSGGTIFDDTGAGFGWLIYQREHANALPVAVTAIENYGRVYRLLKAGVPVSIELNIDTKFTGDHEHGFDTIAEIPGTDPKLKDEVVMVGGHLDSWASATGATDNGAGSVVAMEVMRILNALQVKPRRTIRVGLWTGEEEGEFGSYGYVKQHFGFVPRSNEPDQLTVTEYDRDAAGPIQLKPEHQKLSAYFNLDNGSGKVRGIYLQGNSAIAPIFAQWIEPLKDLGVTRDNHARHRRHRSRSLRRRRPSRIPIHPGPSRLRLAHPPFEHGHLRTPATRRPGPSRASRSHLRLQRRHARPDAPAQTAAPSRARAQAHPAAERRHARRRRKTIIAVFALPAGTLASISRNAL